MVAILRFLGTNCEFDTERAVRALGAEAKIIWHNETKLPQDTKMVILPGGFSYGDYLRSGAIARFAKISAAVREFADRGGLVLGICNGFQILLECGLLSGAMKRNENLHFISKPAKLIVCDNQNALCSSFKQNEQITLPIAHADGNYYAPSELLEQMKKRGQILLKYKDNINGSVEQIAGICNENKNVFGLMPHPERAVERECGGICGAKMIKNLLGFV